MNLPQKRQIFAAVTLCLATFLSAPMQSCALIDDVLDVFQVTKTITVNVLKAWHIVEDVVEDEATAQGLNFPLAKDKHQKVLTRLKEVSKQIAQIEDQHTEQIAVAVDSINNYIESNLKLLHKRDEIEDIINQISSRFEQMQTYEAYQDKLETGTLLDFAEWTVSPSAYSAYNLMGRLSLIMFGAEEKIASFNIFDLLMQGYEQSKGERCNGRQSTQQFLYFLYSDIALTELKSYTMMQFSWMILRIYGKGNYTQESTLMRQEYGRRNEKTVRLLRKTMDSADRSVWRCDPAVYKLGETYEEITRLIQGYIENEVDMNDNRECWYTCNDYIYAKNVENKSFAGQEPCTGYLRTCRYVDSHMSVCTSAENSARRYEYIQYDNGITFGEERKCARDAQQVDSWWRYLFWHCSYCFCYCDDIYSTKTDRYFNLRESRSNVAANRVVTGLRFTKKNRIFHLQIQEGELLPRGNINRTSLAWKPVENYTLHDGDVHNNRDYYTLSYSARSIDLDDVQTDDNTFTVTGVRFRVISSHLNLEVCLTEFNFETGKLGHPENNSFWKSNDNTDVSGNRRAAIILDEPDMPTRTKAKSIPDSRHNQYIEFSPSSMRKDAGQSTVPFIDIQDVTSNPPVPLAGIGIYHKGRPGFGGFLGPKLFTYDIAPHFQSLRNN
ncbi:uncharacterized protein ACN427_000395 [Glossina fuscipes fuscipes]